MSIDQNGVIDQDHKKLLEMLNQSQQLSQQENFHKPLQKLLKQLDDYTRYHFRREEVVMKACGYHYIKNHCGVHHLLINKFELMVEIKSDTEIRDWISGFLTEWLIEHIMVMDKALIPYLQGKQQEVEKALAEFDR